MAVQWARGYDGKLKTLLEFMGLSTTFSPHLACAGFLSVRGIPGLEKLA